jgi:cell division protein FtsW (lipid II flippase)
MTNAASQQSDADNSASSSVEEPILLEWTCHPVRRRPWVSAAVTLFIVVVAMAVFYGTDSRAFAVLALVVLLMSLAKFYMPTSFKFTPTKVYVKTTTQTLAKDWSQYRTFYADRNGVLLSPFAGPSRLENFRGLYLMFEANRDQVLEIVKSRIGTTTPAQRIDSPEA